MRRWQPGNRRGKAMHSVGPGSFEFEPLSGWVAGLEAGGLNGAVDWDLGDSVWIGAQGWGSWGQTLTLRMVN